MCVTAQYSTLAGVYAEALGGEIESRLPGLNEPDRADSEQSHWRSCVPVAFLIGAMALGQAENFSPGLMQV